MAVQKKCRIKSGDKVVVITGKDRGRSGVVSRVYVQKRKYKSDRMVAIVDGVNVKKKHTKANPNAGIEGGILDKEGLIDVSNLAILNPQTNRADRVGYRNLEDGRKVRFMKSNNEVIDE